MLLKFDSYISKSKELFPYRFIMRTIGAYGIIQVFAQDIGVKTGCKQAQIIHKIPTQIIIFTCAAYAVTDDFIQSFIGTLMYFTMKYLVSSNLTNTVCFPNESDVEKCGLKN